MRRAEQPTSCIAAINEVYIVIAHHITFIDGKNAKTTIAQSPTFLPQKAFGDNSGGSAQISSISLFSSTSFLWLYYNISYIYI